jgi:hypothetical protein
VLMPRQKQTSFWYYRNTTPQNRKAIRDAITARGWANVKGLKLAHKFVSIERPGLDSATPLGHKHVFTITNSDGESIKVEVE